MNIPKQPTLILALSMTTVMSIMGCSTTTAGGAVGANRKQLLLVSNDQVMQLSNQSYQETIRKARAAGKLDVNSAQVQRLRRIANRLIPHTAVYRQDAPRWDWQVHVINDNQTNAYVMPGGKVVFYSGIITNLNLSDDEIAAIMGHEMAHALREHSREQISRQVATSGVLNIATSALGLSSGQAQLAGLAGELGLSLPHSRTQEAEADKIGLELMARAGYNPNAAISLWQKMMRHSGGRAPQFLSTHPSPQNRISELQRLIPSVMPLYNASK